MLLFLYVSLLLLNIGIKIVKWNTGNRGSDSLEKLPSKNRKDFWNSKVKLILQKLGVRNSQSRPSPRQEFKLVIEKDRLPFPKTARKKMNLNSNKNQSSVISMLVIAFVSLIFLGISFRQMWQGYTHIAGSAVAFMASLGIVITLFFTNLWFRNSLESGDKTGYTSKLLLAYLVLTVMSFAGNFNAFFTYFMNDDVLTKELIEKHDKLIDISNKAVIALSDQKEVGYSSFIADKKKTLESQIRDTPNKGLGPLAKKELKLIEDKLSTKFTELSIRNSVDDLVANYNSMIDIALEAKLNQEIPNRKEKQELVTEINSEKESLDKKFREAQKDPKGLGFSTCQAIVAAYKSAGAKTQNLVKDFKYSDDLEVDNAQIGTIPHSFGTAFGKNITKVSTWFLTLLSLFIDLGIPLITYLVTKPIKVSDSQTTLFKPTR